MEKSSKNPIIFLPGLMGSIGGEMIPGLGNWSFGVAKWIYDPLVKSLEDMGYRKDQNLYICFYDWRKNVEVILESYLLPMIEKVRKKYPNRSIDLLCHSMGGIVARQYIQGKYYQWDIEKLIMIGTPNKGSLDAYYLWTTGQLVPSPQKSFIKILYRGYIWLLTKILNIPMGTEDIQKFHEGFEGLADLLPTYDYGDFLWVEEESGQWIKIPRGYIKYKNKRLDYLNMELRTLKNRVKDLLCLVGTGYRTNEYLILDKEALLIYGEEAIKGVKTTLEGDNTVITRSGSIEGVNNVVIPASHRGIVEECIEYIAKIYGNSLENEKFRDSGDLDDSLHIIFKGDGELSLDLDGDKMMFYSNRKIDTPFDYIKEEFVGECCWLCFKNIPRGQYSLKLNCRTKQGIKLLVMSAEVDEEYSRKVASNQTQEIINFKIGE